MKPVELVVFAQSTKYDQFYTTFNSLTELDATFKATMFQSLAMRTIGINVILTDVSKTVNTSKYFENTVDFKPNWQANGNS